MLLKMLNKVVLSAYIINLNRLLICTNHSYPRKNNNAPSSESNETPTTICRASDFISFISTYCLRLLK